MHGTACISPVMSQSLCCKRAGKAPCLFGLLDAAGVAVVRWRDAKYW